MGIMKKVKNHLRLAAVDDGGVAHQGHEIVGNGNAGMGVTVVDGQEGRLGGYGTG